MRQGLLDLHERHLAAPETFPPGIRGLDRHHIGRKEDRLGFEQPRGASRVWFVPEPDSRRASGSPESPARRAGTRSRSATWSSRLRMVMVAMASMLSHYASIDSAIG